MISRLFVAALLACPLVAADFRPLFNGKDLDGWKMVGWGRFVVENGTLKTTGGMGLLYYTREKFGNATLRVVFKADHAAKGNSGVFIRMPEEPRDAWYGVHNGYEVQIDAAQDDWHSTGAIYSLSRVTRRNQKDGDWNTLEIRLKGQLTSISVNGVVVNEFRGGQTVPARKQWYEPVRGPRPDSGYIGLQNHDAESVVFFREVSVRRP